MLRPVVIALWLRLHGSHILNFHLQKNLVIREEAVHSQGGDKIGKVHFSSTVQGTSCNTKACSLAQNLLTGLPSWSLKMSKFCKKPASDMNGEQKCLKNSYLKWFSCFTKHHNYLGSLPKCCIQIKFQKVLVESRVLRF